MPPIFPFTAIVGQESMKRALILNAIHPGIGGVLIRGERGTAKSTAARGLAALLPDEQVVTDCRFGCDPAIPGELCTECQERVAATGALPVTTKRTPFVDLPISATEDRVIGTLDIEKAIQKGERHFETGVLAAANRGILYIDEVNLLDDHVVDLLLDAAAMGVNIVEREGISFTHPARFILVGTMNPEEGELRPQLLDRFAMSVEVRGIVEAGARADVIKRNLAFESAPEGFVEAQQEEETELSARIVQARTTLGSVTHADQDIDAVAALTTELEVDGHRADLVILRGARAHAAFEDRSVISLDDIVQAAELALPHRLNKGPFQRVEINTDELQERLAGLHKAGATGQKAARRRAGAKKSAAKKKKPG